MPVLFLLLLGVTLDEPSPVARIEIEGNVRTRTSTFASLLPRPLPTSLAPADIAEVERRIRNLEIFDDVAVAVGGAALRVRVRAKHTIIPSLELSTGRTAAAPFVSVGVTEYNLFGTASGLNLWASWEQRGPNGGVAFWQHPYAPRRWAWGADAAYTTAFFQFDDGARAWQRRQTGVALRTAPPFQFDSFLRFSAAARYVRETVADAVGPSIPPPGHWVSTSLSATRDRYVWDDLVPCGYVIELEGVPGVVVPSGERRHSASASLTAAVPLGRRSVLAIRGEWAGVLGGNVNHSVTLGSVEGVRGLADTFYRNRQQAFANLELRSAVKLAERWALQGVVFGDAATFEPMNADGQVSPWATAAGAGVGARLIPTALVGLLLRVDLARLFSPTELWFLQVGLSQYF